MGFFKNYAEKFRGIFILGICPPGFCIARNFSPPVVIKQSATAILRPPRRFCNAVYLVTILQSHAMSSSPAPFAMLPLHGYPILFHVFELMLYCEHM